MKKIVLLFAILLFNIVFASPSFAIKIGLQTEVTSSAIGTSVKGTIIDANTNHTVCDLDAMKGYEIKPYHNLMAILYKGTYYKINSDNIVIKPLSPGFVSAKGKWYRGIIMIQNKNGKLTVINNVPLEDYIKGVVPSEMPSSWATEAHKAQAIAARSYALANLGKRAKYGYDLKDTPEDQAYGGASKETPDTNYAVDETKGIVLTYNMKVINAYYSASAGGQTNVNSWGSSLPYLRSVPSFDDNVKKNGHGVGMSQHGANNLANQGYNAYQILQYFYKDVKFARVDSKSYN
uniref:SpoIID/LytB domain-containing protein n=1 Tax=Candidatus Stercorousia sp. TaxID=3048886 RepID=UPI004028449E